MLRCLACHKKRGKQEVKNKENVENALASDVDAEKDAAVKENKLCYEIKHSDVMGRYVMASRDIKAGEVIVEVPALAVGPCSGCALICLGCYRELDESNLVKCPGCNWPLCATSCSGLGKYTGHSNYECEALKNSSPSYNNLEELKEYYHALMPLRQMSPFKNGRPREVDRHYRLKKWGFHFDEKDIHTVCGILEVNAFEVGGSGANARALYDAAFLLAHDCTPTTTHTDSEKAPGRPLTVRASISHKAGDVISLCYAYTLQGTLKRREHILLSKFFECSCKRCSDPTELGTYASAFRCPKCAGRILSTAPLEPLAPWRCTDNGCFYTMTSGGVQAMLKRLTDEFEQIDANDVDGFEKFLHKYRNVLHDNHYLCLSALHSLSQLYGKIAGYMIHEMPEEQLHRKIDICRDLMKVFDVIEPGYSRLRGITLYELHAPLMVLTTRDFERKAISKDSLRNRLKEIVSYLTESALILGFEPKQSPEGLMATAAKDALKKIKTWEQIIGKIS
ncbi:unnamed protein product [Leptosia nina]|uniref:Protein msta n=1 Tax=Leptosia nina TaxID=320188 RepID=A0AAV1K163_9NEOP